MESSKKPENGVRGRAADMREHAGLRGPWSVESSLMIAENWAFFRAGCNRPWSANCNVVGFDVRVQGGS